MGFAMQRLGWSISLILCLKAPGVRAAPVPAATTLAKDLPGLQAPPVGRSLFDHLVATPDGKGFDVPFPIESLIAKLKASTGVTPNIVMVPKGRSLQRDRADFDAPRIVYAYDSPAKHHPDSVGIDLKDRLYLGYAEKGEQIEVLSYNGAAGRFEFQVVRDYKQGATPDIQYADRTLCVACHHNGAAIFPTGPWPETNGSSASDHRVADLIEFARGGQKEFHGVPTRVLRQVANDIENSADRSNLVLPYQRLWTDGCGASAAYASACRVSVLRFALELLFTTPPSFKLDSPEGKRLQQAWTKAWPEYLNGSLDLPSPKILTFDALLPSEANTGFPELTPGISAEKAAYIKSILSTAEVPRAVDPLVQFLPPLEVWTLSSQCFGKCVIYGISRLFTDDDIDQLLKASKNDFKRISAAVTALAKARPQLFSNRAFRRGAMTHALLQQLGAPVRLVLAGEEDAPQLPQAHFDRPPVVAIGNREPLALVKSYCLPCHSELTGRRGFMLGTDAEVSAKIKHGAKYLLQRLDWEAQPSAQWRFMPLENPQDKTSQHARLSVHPEDRKVIMAWLKTML